MCESDFMTFTTGSGDFSLLMTTATISENSVTGATGCIMVLAIQDPDYEATHRFMVNINSVSAPAVAVGGAASVCITDDGKCVYVWLKRS